MKTCATKDVLVDSMSVYGPTSEFLSSQNINLVAMFSHVMLMITLFSSLLNIGFMSVLMRIFISSWFGPLSSFSITLGLDLSRANSLMLKSFDLYDLGKV